MNARDRIKNLLASYPRRTVQIGGTVFISIGASTFAALDAKIMRALRRGETVIENGITKWVEFFAVRDNTKDGTDAYTWHRDGNRVKVEKVLITKTHDNSITREHIGFSWCDAIDHV